MREIKPPIDVDSLGKLNEWLADCGMPQRDSRPALYAGFAEPAPSNALIVEYESWGLGFKFPRGDRDAANDGYRELIRFVASGLYARFHDHRYAEVLWPIRPELGEQEVITKLVNPDGSDYAIPDDHRADYEIGDWQIPPEVSEVNTGFSMGRFFCRLAFIPAAVSPPQMIEPMPQGLAAG